MFEEITNLSDIPIYTQHGVQVGVSSEVVIDIEKDIVRGLLVQETNEALVEDGLPVTVPYRWIQSIGDIIILKHFPHKIHVSEEEKRRFQEDYDLD